MRMVDHLVSLATLISLFVIGPALGRAIWARFKFDGHFSRSVCVMAAISLLLVIYGLLWVARPGTVAWYGWLTEIPVNAYVTRGP